MSLQKPGSMPDWARSPTRKDPTTTVSTVTEPKPQTPASPPDTSLLTSQSLLTRLKDWDDHASWREFFDTYWKLIYNVARKAGLSDADAQDIVQEVLVGVAQQMPEFRYDRSKGRFKSWLLTIVRRRLADHWQRTTSTRNREARFTDDGSTGGDDGLEPLWQQEWEQHLLQAALARVQKKVSARHFLIFDLSVVRQTPARRVAAMLGISIPQIWMVRHRVGRLVKAEVKKVEEGV